MAEPLSAEEARQRFRAIARGRHLTEHRLDVETAKARLREVDPGIDIGPLLRHVGERRWKPALLSLLPWILTPEGRTYMAPVLLVMLEAVDRALRLFANRATGTHPVANQEAVKEESTATEIPDEA